MRVLVTGGSGFIGGHVVARLRGQGHEPVLFDRHAQTGSEVFLGDVRDYAGVDAAVGDCDGVIHLAAVLGTQESLGAIDTAVNVNVNGSLNVFNAVRRYGLPAVYIAVGNHWMNNPYSISKTTAERFALMFNKEFGTTIAVVRAYNAYGPGQKAGPVRKIIPNFIIPALRDEELIVYGDGSQVMDMIYVGDVASILVRALGQCVVIEAGTGRHTTVRQIAELVCEIVGRGRIVHVPMRPGEPPGSVVVAPEPLSSDVVPLEEGLRLTIPYYERLESSHLVSV
ncbi:MAG TPA: NAD-dependent epimerase/dehydratase family protein [Dehalococcoidia bacterium]|nr:NAD-dependent epimerase/dehydratase family protein [Dehalococcoidia bacterium]